MAKIAKSDIVETLGLGLELANWPYRPRVISVFLVQISGVSNAGVDSVAGDGKLHGQVTQVYHRRPAPGIPFLDQ